MKAVAATEKDSSRASLPEAGLPEELALKNPLAGSYQQISCLDSVIRYLESCSEATTLKRKCEFPAHLPTLKASDKRKATAGPGPHSAETASPSKVNSHTDVSTHLTSLTLPSEAQSVVSLTSQCSYSSTIVHMGDKKPQPELETVGDAASGPESLDCLAGSVLPCGLGQEQGPFWKLGLTKEVLAAHTQREEQSFLLKFREIRKLSVFQSHCHYYSQDRSKGQSSGRAAPGLRNTSGIDSSWKKAGKNRKLKSKRVKPRDSSGSPGSGGPPPQRLPLVGLNATSWSPSDTSQSSCPAMPFPAPVPAYSLPMFPAPGIVPAPGTMAAAPGALHAGLVLPVDTQREFAVQPPPSAGPLAPVVALVLPSCPFSPVTPSLPPAFFPGQPNLPSEVIPASRPEFPGRTSSPKQPHTCPLAEHGLPVLHVAAQAALPSAAGSAGRTSPPLFQSHGSSPLQLSLLQLEEAPEGGSAAAGTTGPTETVRAGPDCQPGSSWDRRPEAPPTCDKPKDAQSSSALCTPSGLLHLLLREDLCSATGSAPSGSGASTTSCCLGSGSLGCDALTSGSGSSNTGHTSKYFGSIDSSENNHRAKVKVDMAESERLKDVLQDPVWLLGADTDDSVMMAYQMPSR
ncbi:period circadian protein [Pontoporia blainvillei]|uniref:Period circadian protein n=1 Tax=Pontoporia blainvillei TaxID=48723 RepID=A0ABX0S638_PONBL|nr:period circadian protein [Pontoporia blainvillei]